MAALNQIVPRNKTKGTDICGRGDYLYIIRSDLGIFVKARHVHDVNHPPRLATIRTLHSTCTWRDHYMAAPDPNNPDRDYFYIIKGSSCSIVANLETGEAPVDANPPSFELHENFRGADFYMARNSNCFYAIKSSSNTYRHLNSLENNTLQEPEGRLSFNCREGLYYWSTENHFCFLRPTGLEYHQNNDLYTDNEGINFQVYSPLSTFLQGGLEVTTTNQIAHHNQAKGTDICRRGDYLYIIRSDLGIFVKARHEHNVNHPAAIRTLHRDYRWGDHYMAAPDPNNPDRDYFYIIKGVNCRVVADLETGEAPINANLQTLSFNLAENCRGADFYMARNSNCFYAIKSSSNTYRHLNSLENNTLQEPEGKLSFNCREGLYYWSTDNHFCFLQPTGLEYHQTEHLDTDNEGTDNSFSSPISTFLPAMDLTRIVPRNKAKGIDFCGQGSYQYIIRSDLGCYMKAYHVRDGDDPVTIHPLHPSCAWGDHYMATPDHFYIVKGDECRIVDDLRTGANPKMIKLHQDCRNGDFYMAQSSNSFFIIRLSSYRSICLCVKDLEKGSEAKNWPWRKAIEENDLHADCIKGHYYWATTTYFYFLKPISKWSLEYHRTKDLCTPNKEGRDFPVYPPITAFLPGGLAVIMGPAIAKWELIKTIDNTNGSADFNSKGVMRKNGYKKQALHSVQCNWTVSAQEGLTTEKVATAALKQLFSHPLIHCGCEFDCTEEDWTEEHEVKVDYDIIVPRANCRYIWQLKFGMGKGEQYQDIFYTQRIETTDTLSPPPGLPTRVFNGLYRSEL